MALSIDQVYWLCQDTFNPSWSFDMSWVFKSREGYVGSTTGRELGTTSDQAGPSSDAYQFRVCIYLSLIWYLLFDKAVVQGKSRRSGCPLPLLNTPFGLHGLY
jgi:hypothetical protein